MKKAKTAQSNLFNTPVAPVAERWLVSEVEPSRSHEATSATEIKTESLKELSIRLRNEAIKEKQKASGPASKII